MGYRHRPLSQRLGIAFNEASYWRLDFEGAECFMYFIGSLRLLFDENDTFYCEGLNIDPDLEALYASASQEGRPAMQRLMRHPKAKAWHLPLTRENHKRLAAFATSKTFEQLCDALLVYRGQDVLLDGTRIGERLALLSGEFKEARVKRFCATVGGKFERVEEA